jgi:hypothetical protein
LLIEIFSSTIPSAKSSRLYKGYRVIRDKSRKLRKKAYPLAMAPTKTATEWVGGSLVRYSDSRIVGASADRADMEVSTRFDIMKE